MTIEKARLVYDPESGSVFVQTPTSSVPLGPIGYTRPDVGAVARTIPAKLEEFISLLDFTDADPTGVSDNTTPFNAMALASTPYSGAVYREMVIPAGRWKLGSGGSRAFVRLGQHLRGVGWPTIIDATANAASTTPLITIGRNSALTADSFGFPAQVSDLFFDGSTSATAANILAEAAGYDIDKVWMTGPGVGVDMSGADGVLSRSRFDQGLNPVRILGHNHTVTECEFFGESTGNYYITLLTGTTSPDIRKNRFNYFAYNAILFQTGATGIRGVRVSGNTFEQNVQHASSEAAISMRAVDAELFLIANFFYNLYGAGLIMVHPGSRAVSKSNTFDGQKTNSTYAQSSTMRGIYAYEAASLRSTGDTFMRLPGIPIEIAGSQPIDAVINAATFLENTSAGGVEIVVSNTNAASVVRILNSTPSSGRTLASKTGAATVIVDGVAL